MKGNLKSWYLPKTHPNQAFNFAALKMKMSLFFNHANMKTRTFEP